MKGGYVFVSRVPYNLALVSSYHQGNRLYVTGRDVLIDKNVYTLNGNRITIVPNGYSNFYIDTTDIPAGIYTLSVNYSYNGINRNGILQVTIGKIVTSGTGTTVSSSVGSPPVSTTVEVPSPGISVFHGSENTGNVFLNFFDTSTTDTKYTNITNYTTYTAISGVSFSDNIFTFSLNVKTLSGINYNQSGTFYIYKNRQILLYYKVFEKVNAKWDYLVRTSNIERNDFNVVLQSAQVPQTPVPYNLIFTSSGNYSLRLEIFSTNSAETIQYRTTIYFNFTIIIPIKLTSLSFQENNLLATVTPAGSTFYLDDKLNQIVPAIQGDNYTLSMENRPSGSYKLIIANGAYADISQNVDYVQPSFSITNFAQTGPTIGWTSNPATNASYFIGTEDITTKVSNYSVFMTYPNGDYTLYAKKYGYIDGSYSFTYVVPTFKLTTITQIGNLIRWNASNSVNASHVLVNPLNVSADITFDVTNPSDFTYAMTSFDQGIYTLYLFQAGYATDSRAFNYTPPYFRLRNFTQRGAALSWNVSNRGNYVLADPENLVSSITCGSVAVNGGFADSFAMTGSKSGTYTLMVGTAANASESVYFDYTPPSLEIPVQQGDLISWRDETIENTSYFLKLTNNTRIDITQDISYNLYRTYTMGRLRTGNYDLILSAPDYPEVFQTFAYTTRIILDKVVQRGNQLNLVGIGFTSNVSFFLDEYMTPPALTNRVNAIQFDPSNLDMLHIAGSNTVLFEGTFTGSGTWTFNLSSNNANLKIDGQTIGNSTNQKAVIPYTSNTATKTLLIEWYQSNSLFFSYVPPGGTETIQLNHFKTGNLSGLGYTAPFTSTQDYTQHLKLFYFGNSSRVNGSYQINSSVITRLEMAYQQDRRLTLVGTGLTGLVPSGLTTEIASDTQPTFTGYVSGPVNVSTFGHSTDTVPIITANTDADMISVRNAPSANIPEFSTVTTQFITDNVPHVGVYFGYFRPIVSTNSFVLTADDVLDFRIGTNATDTLYSLRNNITHGTRFTRSKPTLDLFPVTNTNTATLTANQYYPILIGYANSRQNSTLVCTTNGVNIMDYCTTDKSTPGLYYYRLNRSLMSTLVDNPTASVLTTYNNNLVTNFALNFFHVKWAYGTLENHAYFPANTSYLVGNTYIPSTRLNLSSVRYQNRQLLIKGTGFHQNVSVFVNNVPVTSTYDGDLNVSTGPFASVYLTDGLVKSNTYTIFNISSIDKTLAVRNSFVNISGSNFANVSYVMIGNVSANFSVVSTAHVRVKVPESIQTQADFSIYDTLGGSMFVTTFTIPPPFTLTSYTPSRVWPSSPLQIQGTNLYDLGSVTMGPTVGPVGAVNFNYTPTALNASIVGYGQKRVVVSDPYGYSQSILVPVTGMDYAFQVDNQLTLVGTGLAGLNPGLPEYSPSDKAPVFTGKLTSVNVSEDGIFSNTVQVLPVTVTGANGVVSVRGLTGPDGYGVRLPINPTLANYTNTTYSTYSQYNTPLNLFTIQSMDTVVITKVSTYTSTTMSNVFGILYNRTGSTVKAFSNSGWNTLNQVSYTLNLDSILLEGTNYYRLYIYWYEKGYQIIDFLYTAPYPATNLAKPTTTADQVQAGIGSGKFVSVTLVNQTLNVSRISSPAFTQCKIDVYNPKNESSSLTTSVFETFTYNFENDSKVLKGTHRYAIFIRIYTGQWYIQTEYIVYNKAAPIVPSPDTYSTTMFGYFKPTVPGTHTFTVNAYPEGSLRLGNTDPFDLFQGPTLLNTSTSATYTFSNTSHYPIVITYANTSVPNPYFSPTVTYPVNSTTSTDKYLIEMCTTDKTTPGLYYYNLSGDKRRTNLWGYGDQTLQTFWTNASQLSLIEAPVPVTPLNLSSVEIANQILTLTGTGIHANVSVFLDQIPYPMFSLGNVSIVANFSSIQLRDGLAQTTPYSMFGITSQPSTAIRNSSVNLSGYNLSSVSAVKFGTVDASFVLFSNRIEVKVPESTQTQPLTVYDASGSSFVVSTFTIPPLFSITSFNTSSLIQNASLTITGANFSRLAYVQFADKTAIPSFTPDTIEVKVPEVVGNVSVTVVDVFNNRASVDGLNVSRKLSIQSISPVRACPGAPVTIFGEDFYEISLNVSTYTYTLSTITFSTPSTNQPIVAQDPYGNQASIPFTVINLSYAFQVLDKLTLVGEGLTGLSPGLDSFYPSDKAPMFTGVLSNVNVSLDGYFSNTVTVVPVTVIRSVVNDVITVRGMPAGKIPYSSSIVSS